MIINKKKFQSNFKQRKTWWNDCVIFWNWKKKLVDLSCSRFCGLCNHDCISFEIWSWALWRFFSPSPCSYLFHFLRHVQNMKLDYNGPGSSLRYCRACFHGNKDTTALQPSRAEPLKLTLVTQARRKHNKAPWQTATVAGQRWLFLSFFNPFVPFVSVIFMFCNCLFLGLVVVCVFGRAPPCKGNDQEKRISFFSEAVRRIIVLTISF